MILHICELTSDFFDSQFFFKNDIAHLHACNGFFNSCKRKNGMILHICKLTSGFFDSHKEKKTNDIAPL
jgi:hypothetical protein